MTAALKNKILSLLMLLFLIISGIFTLRYDEPSTNNFSGKEPARVVDVIDGDTVTVLISDKEYKVRLIGIDTPETKHPNKDVECFGLEASRKTEEMLDEKDVYLEADASQNDKDRYGRLLRYIYLKDGTLVNEKLVREGYAYEYTYRVPYKFQKEFVDAQKEAENSKAGLWNGLCPIRIQ